jgi:uncharacterized protein YdbL (DUF1318 family)
MLNLRLPFFMTFLLLNACVTINVYFPAAAAEKAADQIIDGVWGEKPSKAKAKKPDLPLSKQPSVNEPEDDNLWGEPEDKPSTTPVPDKESKAPSPVSIFASGFIGLLDFIISPAYAAPNLEISTPRIKALENRMATRHRKLRQGYINGAIGLTKDGLIQLRSPKKVPLKYRSKVKRLISDENKDRLQLYSEIAKANRKPQWVGKIRKIFARRWIERASSGWMYQDNKGRWKRK